MIKVCAYSIRIDDGEESCRESDEIAQEFQSHSQPSVGNDAGIITNLKRNHQTLNVNH